MPLCFPCPRQSSAGTSLLSPTVNPAHLRGWTLAQRSPLGCEQSRPHATQILAQRGARLPASTASAAAARHVRSASLVGRIALQRRDSVCVRRVEPVMNLQAARVQHFVACGVRGSAISLRAPLLTVCLGLWRGLSRQAGAGGDRAFTNQTSETETETETESEPFEEGRPCGHAPTHPHTHTPVHN